MSNGKLPPWDPDEEDRRIVAERRAAKSRLPRPEDARATTTIRYQVGQPRGLTNDNDLRRRAEVERAMRRRQRLERDGSRPRLISGRWEARRRINGKRYRERFDTEQEAQAWLNNLNGER